MSGTRTTYKYEYQSRVSSRCNRRAAEASGFLCGPGSPLDFRGLRLDWLRMQASMSSARSNVQLRENARLASHLNTIALYTRLIDELEPLLQDTSDLSLFWCASCSE